MERKIWALAVLVSSAVLSSAQEFTRAEFGISGSVLFNNRFLSKTDAGTGGRFTYNFSPSLALESELAYFPTNATVLTVQDGGTAISLLAGVKAGVRRRRFGLFLKARPGIMSFSDAVTSAARPLDLTTARKTHAAFDWGGVFELYPSRRIVLRLEAGEMLMRYGDATLFSTPAFSDRTIGTIESPFHLIFGVGYKIGRLQEQTESIPKASTIQFGLQYSLQTLQRAFLTKRDESALGGWFTNNFNRHFGLDAAGSFFPRRQPAADFQQGGQMIQAVAGIRWGIRRDHWGVFAKFRPGVQIYTLSSGFDLRQVFNPGHKLPTLLQPAFDSGGIFEIYTSKHTLFRIDAGDTVIHYRERHFLDDVGTPFSVPASTRSSIQLTAGFGWRF